jgi:disulfide bond formation protein DsbB
MFVTAVAICVVGFLGLIVLLALARRALRLIVRIALAVVLLILMAIGIGFAWWRGSTGSTSKPEQAHPSPTRRSTR